MSKNQSKLRLIESDLLAYHVRRMDQRIGVYRRELVEEESKSEPDAGVLLRLRTQIKRDELSKSTPDVTEREVLEPLRAAVVHETALKQAGVLMRRQPVEVEGLVHPVDSLRLEVHDALLGAAAGDVISATTHRGAYIGFSSEAGLLDERMDLLNYSLDQVLVHEEPSFTITVQPAETHSTGKRRKAGDVASKRRPPSRSVPSE